MTCNYVYTYFYHVYTSCVKRFTIDLCIVTEILNCGGKSSANKNANAVPNTSQRINFYVSNLLKSSLDNSDSKYFLLLQEDFYDIL